MNNIIAQWYEGHDRQTMEFNSVKDMKHWLSKYDVKYAVYYKFVGEYVEPKKEV